MALYIPTDSYWLNDSEADASTVKLTTQLMEQQIDFDHIDHDTLASICTLEKDGLKNESGQVVKTFRETFHINLSYVDATDIFLSRLAGVDDPEKKRKIIGKTFIEVFEEEAKKVSGSVEYLAQGTLYPDVIESVSFKGPSVTIKSHHNVG